MASGNREDYLISILRLTEGEKATKTTELASWMGIAPASVTEMLKILSNEGYVEYEKYKGVKLTEKGIMYARQIRKKHHIYERFLTDVLEVDHEKAHAEAHQMEHILSDESAVKMCHIVGAHVDSDCESCSDPCKALTGNGVMITERLIDMTPGDSGRISHIKDDNPDNVKKLISMGFVPGRDIVIDSKISDRGPRIIRIGNSTIALDADMAACVFIEVA